MKIRIGFVSNSSSSSFEITLKNFEVNAENVKYLVEQAIIYEKGDGATQYYNIDKIVNDLIKNKCVYMLGDTLIVYVDDKLTYSLKRLIHDEIFDDDDAYFKEQLSAIWKLHAP